MHSKKISSIMYKLLIEQSLDGFSVIQLRDAAQNLPETKTGKPKTRRLVYRQILKFKANGWLEEKGSGRQKMYYKTTAFFAQKFEIKKESEPQGSNTLCEPDEVGYEVLSKELSQYQGELEIVLAEIEEYRSLKVRFPLLEPNIKILLEEARVNSARILGKVNGVTKLLSNINQSSLKC